MDVAAVLESKTRTHPDKPALIFQDQLITFAQLRDISFQFANSLKDLGIKKGDKVAIYLPNCPEYIIMQDAKAGISNYQPLNAYTYGPQDQVENIFTLKVSTDFMHERLKPEVLWSFTDDNQGRLSPKITYELKDNLWLTLGIHYFYGHEQDTNGQYRDQNQLYTQLKYTF